MTKPIQKIDDLLNQITMYRLVLYGLVWLGIVAALLSVTGVLSYPIEWLVKSGIALSIGCGLTNQILARAYKVPTNHESSIITMLILFFILKPPGNIWDMVGVGIAGGVAMVSKYALTWRGAVVFNPAAFGVMVVSVVGLSSGSWWVASKYLVVPTLILGLLILRKTRRFQLLGAFLAPAVLLLVANGVEFVTIWYSFPLVFLGCIMLTEPATIPATKRWQFTYGFIIGVLCGLRLDLGFLSVSPHVALLLGNVFACVVSARAASVLTLDYKRVLTPTSHEFVFRPHRKLSFEAGQYAEFTLTGVGVGTRGNRRTFTIASSPQDSSIGIGVKFYEPSSLFKKKLLSMQPGDQIVAAHASGDFILPKASAPLLLVAGGIGVTPFVSMVRDLVARQEKRDVVLVYFAAGDQEIAYRSVFDAAKNIGVKTVYVTNPTVRLDQSLLASEVPDFVNRRVYISGPPAMVRGYKKSLRSLGVRHIKTDYFTGY